MPKPRIFLSYRRDDSVQATRNIRHGFVNAGFGHVFMDIPEIHSGEKWPDRINDELEAADVVIAVIGESWFSSHDADLRRRIGQPDDPVRWELRTALQLKKRIIPVLVGRAGMPSAKSLPDDIRELASYHAKQLTSANWEDDLRALVLDIDRSRTGVTRPAATLVLTSTSPRRKQLLRTIGWTAGEDYFPVHASVPPDDSDVSRTVAEARDLAQLMAKKKIAWLRENPNALFEQLPYGWSMTQTILIGVDTIVFCRDKVIDRPLLKALQFAGPLDITLARVRAQEMLRDERGQTIQIITGLAVADLGSHAEPVTMVTVTEAKLREYSESDIASYISRYEPFDKAGAFGIQDQGVSLFERITGSYTNVVGLPLREFTGLLEREYSDRFTLPEPRSSLPARKPEAPAADAAASCESLSVVCLGDINYDFIYDNLPPDGLADLAAQGTKVRGTIRRAVGGTAVNFARGAKQAGFAHCSVVGVVGGDALGQQILNELAELKIDTICHRDPAIKSSVAIIMRGEVSNNVSFVLTDAHQSLPTATVDKALTPIENSDVVYCSGYCLTDSNRHDSALTILRAAKRAKCLVVLDVVVDMFQDIRPAHFERSLRQDETSPLADVVVAQLPDVLDWLGVAMAGQTELELWQRHRAELLEHLRERFAVAILRTRGYAQEIVITPDRVDGPHPLDYGTLRPGRRTGYGDVRTASLVHSFLSPRIVLASKSTQRLDLLRQIVAPSKIQVIASTSPELVKRNESPEDRVRRIAEEKAQSVFDDGKFHDDIELIIGADTEIVRQDADGDWEMIGHPTSAAEAHKDLSRLNNGTHYALTGLAVIGKDPGAGPGRIKTFVVCEKTTVTFIDASEKQLRAYAETGEPIGRAGAYAIQGLGILLIKSVDGSYSNVVGLPLERLSQVLADEFGKPIWRFDKVSNWCFPDPIKGLRW